MTSNRTTIALAIGRNVSDPSRMPSSRPMDARSWEAFITAADGVVLGVNGQIFTRARGRGEWDGGSEDSYVLIGCVPTTLLEVFRHRLALLASQYGQEGVGLVVHNNGTESVVWS